MYMVCKCIWMYTRYMICKGYVYVCICMHMISYTYNVCMQRSHVLNSLAIPSSKTTTKQHQICPVSAAPENDPPAHCGSWLKLNQSSSAIHMVYWCQRGAQFPLSCVLSNLSMGLKVMDIVVETCKSQIHFPQPTLILLILSPAKAASKHYWVTALLQGWLPTPLLEQLAVLATPKKN